MRGPFVALVRLGEKPGRAHAQLLENVSGAPSWEISGGE